MPSAPCGRPAITPSRRGPWASACSTPSPSRALHARAAHGAERVAVVDFDVHHGNGTQAAFWSDKDLFYGSTHQMPLFPGTGALSETGVGNIFNAPLKPGDDGDDFREAFGARILPALDDFRARRPPDLGRVRRPSQRPAGADQADRGRFRLGDRASCWRRPRSMPAAGSSRRSRAATTSMRWRARRPSMSRR